MPGGSGPAVEFGARWPAYQTVLGVRMAGKRVTKSWRLLANAAHLYRLRTREQPLRELLAIIGIASGVALLFAVQVASTSFTGSLRQLVDGIAGGANVEVAARGVDGMPQATAIEAARVPGVAGAAPILQSRATIEGPRGRAAINVIGVDRRLERIGGPLVKRFAARRDDLDSLGLFMMKPLALKLGVAPGDRLRVIADGVVNDVILADTFDQHDVRGLVKAPVAIASLGTAQRLTGMQGRISRVLVKPESGDVQPNLRRALGDRYAIRSDNAEVDLFNTALIPDRRSSAVLSATALLIGLLFAYNAMLLSMARRRRQVEQLGMLGADRMTIIATLAFEVLFIGIAASILGVLLGDLLVRIAFHAVPRYLSVGFVIGGQRVIEPITILISVLAGLGAAGLAALMPALDLMRGRNRHRATHGDSGQSSAAVNHFTWFAWAGVVVTVMASAVAWLVPPLIPVCVIFGLGGLLVVVARILHPLFGRMGRLTRTRGSASTSVAFLELSSNPVRALALAMIATGAMAGVLSIGGGRMDLERGLVTLTTGYFTKADIWLLPSTESNVFETDRFDPEPLISEVRRLPGVADASISRWEFLDLAKRRVLLVSPPEQMKWPIVRSQVIDGNYEQASRRVSDGGWIAISTAIADELGTGLGRGVTIPTPTGPRTYRVAAVTANHGWPSGSIVLGGRDYRRDFRSRSASTIGVDLAPGVSTEASMRRILALIHPPAAVTALTPKNLIDDKSNAFKQGLTRLKQISTMVLGASLLALIAAMTAAVWQRRRRLAGLRTLGMSRRALGRSLMTEVVLVVSLGALAGLPVGLYGQIFSTRWSSISTGYQSSYEPAVIYGVKTLLIMTVLAACVTLIPILFATRVTPGLDDEMEG